MAALEPAPMSLNFSTTPDVIEWLPPGAADRLRALRQRFSDSHRLIPASEDRLAASNAKIEAERRLSRLLAHQSAAEGGFNLKPDDLRVIEQRRLVDKLSGEFAKISELYEVRAEKYRTASGVLTAVEGFLKDRPGVLEDYKGGEVKLAKNESLLDAIERLRRRGRELVADKRRVESAPFPSSHAKRRAREQVEELAQRGAVSVSRLVELDGPLEFPMMMLKVPIHNAQGALGVTEVIDVAALLAFMFKDLMLKKIDAEIDSESEDAAALAPEARARATDVALGDLLAVERDEAALVWRAQSENLPVEHRSDCSPLAILQCALAAPAVSERGSSWSFTMGGAR